MSLLTKITPNQITWFRLSLLPIVILMLYLKGSIALAVCLILLMVIFPLDILDGWLARKTNQITEFGKHFDPLVDKLTVMSIFVCFTNLDWMPAWMVIIILARALIVTEIRGYLKSKGVSLPAKWSGKLKTLAHMMLQLFLIFINIFSIKIDGQYFFFILLTAPSASLISLVDYGFAGWRKIKALKK